MYIKSYYDYMAEISADELYDGLLGYGLFTEKLPPIFTSEAFLHYCRTNNPVYDEKSKDYISFNIMRNINIPRTMGIPTPMKYEVLCRTLRDNWNDILHHFSIYTGGQNYRVSRIHLRKLYDRDTGLRKPELFEMNYRNYKIEDNPEDDLLIGQDQTNKYVVHADISTCFPSIYTHSIPWALVGKNTAKVNRTQRYWYNKIDRATQYTKNGETHGLIIGPHTSNLLSEIILVVVDYKLLNKNYLFIRNIDDYDCYVSSYEEGQKFITDLEKELREYDLPLNHKKTKIDKLPVTITKEWKHILNSVSLIAPYGKTSFTEVTHYLDTAIELSNENNDSAVLKYAIKALSKLDAFTSNGQKTAEKRILHLATIYPYLLHDIEKCVFIPFHTHQSTIEQFANAIYAESINQNNLEGICYSIYYSIKYDFEINGIDIMDLINTNDCLCRLFAWLYYKKHPGTREIAILKQDALNIVNTTDFERNWLFVYEILDANDLPIGEWRDMKNQNISFLRAI